MSATNQRTTLDVSVGGQTLAGGEGIDTLELLDPTGAGASVNLMTGRVYGRDADGDWVSSSVSGYEHLVGTGAADGVWGTSSGDYVEGRGGNDALYGFGGGDTLDGGIGDDTVHGGAGNDSLEGGTGRDTASFFEYRTVSPYQVMPGVSVDLAAGTAAGHGTDTLSGFEDVEGSLGDDTIAGDSGANRLWGLEGADDLKGRGGADFLYGGRGSDTLEGGTGADALDGGFGSDTASYASSATRVVVDLGLGFNRGGDADGDTLTGIEHLTGSAHGDTLTGGLAANHLRGGAGADQLTGGGGVDTLAGGAGADTLLGDGLDVLDYSESGTGVHLNLARAAGYAGDAQGDSLSGSFACVIGSAHTDRLEGSVGDDILEGGAGADVLQGYRGADVLQGGAGADLLSGGHGADTVSYADAGTGVAVQWTLTGGTGTAGDAAGDTLQSIEYVIGSAHADTLSGFTRADGGAGDDVFVAPVFLVGSLAHPSEHHYRGGEGSDQVSYEGYGTGIVSDLIRDGLYYQGHEIGTYNSIERIRGSEHGDWIRGSADADTLEGGGGDDTLGGRGGADSLDGGAGTDLLSFADARAGVSLSLDTGGTAGDAAGDRYANFEKAEGSAYGDTLTGNSSVSTTLEGGAGADSLSGGAAGDSLAGGAGADTLSGAGGADTLDGGSEADLLSGGQGADSLSGGAGTDTLRGGAGADTLTGGAGGDHLVGGAGADLFVIENANHWSTVRIGDFSAGDRIDLTAFRTNWASLERAIDSAVSHTRIVDGSSVAGVTFTIDLDPQGPHALFVGGVGIGSDTFVESDFVF